MKEISEFYRLELKNIVYLCEYQEVKLNINHMRIIFSTLLFCLLSTISFAQNEREHLNFLGIPMKGSVQEFIGTLCKEKGLIKEGTSKIPETGETVYSLKGYFWKFKNCDIGITENPDKTVHQATVVIRDLSIYRRSIDLNELIENYNLKYGPYKVVHETDKDIDVLVWETSGGRIQYKELYIPDILDALRIDYIDCDMSEIQRQRMREIGDL